MSYHNRKSPICPCGFERGGRTWETCLGAAASSATRGAAVHSADVGLPAGVGVALTCCCSAVLAFAISRSITFLVLHEADRQRSGCPNDSSDAFTAARSRNSPV